MIGAPDRADNPGQRREIAEENAAPVIRPQGRETPVAAHRPGMRQMAAKRDAADMDDEQMRGQRGP
jgi:hypothetical protein